MFFNFLVKANRESSKSSPWKLRSHFLTRTGNKISICHVTQDPNDIYGYNVAIEANLSTDGLQDLIKEFHSNQQDFEIIAYFNPFISTKFQYIVYETEFENSFVTNLFLFKDNYPDTINDNEREFCLKLESKKGDILFVRGDYEEAVIAYKNAMILHLRKNGGQQNDPVVCDYLKKIGSCYIELRQYHRSSATLQKAILALNLIDPDFLEKRAIYIEIFAKSLILQGKYHEAKQWLTSLIKLYNQLIEKNPASKDNLTENILNAEKELHYCNMQLTDLIWYGVPNPYGRNDYLAPDPNESRQSQVSAYQIGMSVVQTNPNGERIEFDSYEINTPMKFPDPAKFQQALKDALKAVQLDQMPKYHRIIMAFPVEKRQEFMQYVRSNGFERLITSTPLKELENEFMRPLTLHNTFVGDPHLTQRGPDSPKQTNRPVQKN